MLDKNAIHPPIFEDLSHIHGPFDIIGDVHGCFDELLELLKKLDYNISKLEDVYKVSHLNNRKLIFVGDLVDRGPKTPEVLRLIMDMTESDIAYSVRGNHDDKLKRALQNHYVIISDGLETSLEQLNHEPDGFKNKVKDFLAKLKAYYIFDNGKLIVSHAGLTSDLIGKSSKVAESFCLYGTATHRDNYGRPIRDDWAKDYKGEPLIVYGHTPVSEATLINNTIDVDTGCVWGGKLTAFRYPEKTISVQPAFKQYY